MIYDTIIIGLGCAGMSASIYAKRSNLNVLVIEKGMPGGLINQTSLVDNYLGFQNITGPELVKQMNDHFKSYDIPVIKETVESITLDSDLRIIKTNKNTYKTKSVIISTGRRNKRLPLENIDIYEGKGISYCALCDGNFFKGKDVAIVGAGNSAFEEGLYLANICRKIYILVRGLEIRASKLLQSQLQNTKNVELIYNAEVKELKGKNTLENLVLSNDQTIKVSGLFVYIGFEAAADFANHLNITNTYGYINVNEDMETSVEGIFACGDIVNKKIYQITNAVSEGAICGINVEKYRNKE